jgi:hypothetical protein
MDMEETLYEVGEADPTGALAKAIEHLAVAIEGYQRGVASVQRPALAALPPVQPGVAPVAGGCPIHNQPWKLVPGGISKKTGNPYSAFSACPVQGCDQRPPR